MKKTSKLIILETNAGGGHQSISHSIVQILNQKQPKLQIHRVNIAPGFIDQAYKFAARQFLTLYQLAYKATDHNLRKELASKISLQIQKTKLKKILTQHNPDIILSNTQIGIQEIPPLLKQLNKDIPFLVFVPDPFTPHAFCFNTKSTHTFVSSLDVYHQALKAGLDPQQLTITGHPIRAEFYNYPTNLTRHRKSLKLNPSLFTILFGGSGDGAEKTLQILLHLGVTAPTSLLKELLTLDITPYTQELIDLANRLLHNEHPTPPSPTHFQAIFITGTNTKLKAQLQKLKFPAHIKPHIIGFTDRIADYIHAADLIVGKAGPNIIFEAAAAGKPFLATYHIKGQETGNINFIRISGIGFVEEHPTKAAALITQLVQHPQILNSTHPHLNHIAATHRHAASNIAQQILSHLDSN